jgi:hypothetical protein
LDNTHGNVFLGVANGSACTMHSLAWGNAKHEKEVFKAIAKGTPGQVIDLPTPNHIVVDIKPRPNIKWPQHLNLSPDSNVIRIPIGLTMDAIGRLKLVAINLWHIMHMLWIWLLPSQFGNVKVAPSNTS